MITLCALAAAAVLVQGRVHDKPFWQTIVQAKFEVPAGDPDRLADRILWLLEQPQLMQETGASARRRYEELYSKGRFMQRMTDLFEEIAG